MKIVVAPNAFKGSLSAVQAAAAMARGIRCALPDADVRAIPVADGGDGLVLALEQPLAAERRRFRVTGPLGDPVDAEILYCAPRSVAVIEMALASGLALLDTDRLDPLRASSEGVGQLIRHALDLGARHIVLGIGGSATTDGGTGLATALGVRFLDGNGNALRGDGASLGSIRRIDSGGLDRRLADLRLEVACDVDNPLLGNSGAAAVYAPQKGAGPAEVEELERGLANFAEVLQRQFDTDVRELPGAGAAGGMGGGLHALFGAELKPGAALVLELLQVEEAIADADLVLTGEGRLDYQTAFGKAPGAVAALAARHGVPCIAIAGMLDETAHRLHAAGFTALFSLCPGPLSLDDALRHADRYLAATAEQIMRCAQIARDARLPDRA